LQQKFYMYIIILEENKKRCNATSNAQE